MKDSQGVLCLDFRELTKFSSFAYVMQIVFFGAHLKQMSTALWPWELDVIQGRFVCHCHKVVQCLTSTITVVGISKDAIQLKCFMACEEGGSSPREVMK